MSCRNNMVGSAALSGPMSSNVIHHSILFSILGTAILLGACADRGSSNANSPAVAGDQSVPTYPISDSLFGTVVARATDNCLQTVAHLKPGTPIQIIIADRSSVAKATVGNENPGCADGVTKGRNAYLIDTYDLVPGDFGIALLAADVPVENARTNIDGDQQYESYRFCTSKKRRAFHGLGR